MTLASTLPSGCGGAREMQEKTSLVQAEPYAFELKPAECALLIIDMQRDFLEPGGFGEMLGNDVSQLRRTIEPNRRLLAAWRAAGLLVMHTREGHRPDLSDLPPSKKMRGRSATTIGEPGPMGRILVRGEAGPRHHPRALSGAGRAGDRQARQGRFLRHGPAPDPAASGHHSARGDRCHHGRLREHHRARGQRSRLRLPRAGGLRRLLLPRVPGDGAQDDQGAGRHLRLGHQLALPVITADRPSAEEGTAAAIDDGLHKPKLWTPGDWNAFFGFGTNILVNLLVLTGLLRFVLKMPDDLVFGRILPATGLMLLPEHPLLRLAGLQAGEGDRARRRLCAAVGHQRAAHVRGRVRDHAADPR